MEPQVNNCLLPPGTIHNYQPNVLTTPQALEQADQMVKKECKKVTEAFAISQDADALASDVYRITALFSSLQLIGAHSDSSSRRLTSADEDMNELTQLFSKVVLDLDEQARAAFERGDLNNAKRSFKKLSSTQQYHIGSERDHYIRACSFTTDVKECSGRSLITEAANGSIIQDHETARLLSVLVSQYTTLKREPTPDSLRQWKENIGSSIIQYIKGELKKNNAAVRDIWNAIQVESKSVEGLLTAEKLQGIEFTSLLEKLHPIQARLTLLQANLTTCLESHAILAKHCQELQIENGSKSDDVQTLVTYWIHLTTSAIELLSNLADAESVEAKNDFLLSWIEKHINSYKDEKPSALHTWAFSLLGKFFISRKLSEDALHNSINLVRKYSSILLTHSRVLLVDVDLQIENDRKSLSHLLLGVISGMLERTSCTSEKVKEFHDTWTGVPCIGRPIERLRVWKIGERIIPIDMHIEGNEEGHTLVQRAKSMNTLLEALQSNHFEPLGTLTHEEVVALFEVAHYILEMPQDIVDLSIKRLDTPKLRKSLGALLWLRFAQACRVDLPHTSLEKLFDPLTKEEFLKWITLYNPARHNAVDMQKHTMLFTAIVNKASRLLEDDKLRLSDDEIEKIIRFVADRYEELLKLKISPTEKVELDSGLVRLSCLALIKSKNTRAYYTIDALEKIDALNTKELEKIKHRFGDAVIEWLEKRIYPRLHLLRLSGGLDTKGLGNIGLCTSIVGLGMPLPQSDVRAKLERLAKFAPHIATLELWNGEIEPELFDHFDCLQNVSIRDCTNYLDFSKCPKFLHSVRRLILENVGITPGTLRWVAHANQLEQLSIKLIQDGTIGSLADQTVVHAHHGFKSLSIELTSFDSDPDLVASLPRLLETFESISSLTLKGHSSQSLLEVIIQGKETDSQVEELVVTWNNHEQIAHIAAFERLKKLHCLTAAAGHVTQMREFLFEKRPEQLVEWKALGNDGTIVPIAINVRQELNRSQ